MDDRCKVSCEDFHNPVFVHDSRLNVIACPVWREGMINWQRDKSTGLLITPLEELNEFKTDREYLKTLTTTKADIFSADLRGCLLYTSNSEISDIGGGQVYIYVSNDAITEQEWITPEDINAVRDLESVEGVSVAESYDGETVTGKGNCKLMVTAEGPDPKMVNNADRKYGNYVGEREVEEAKPVCVISDADARRLFGTDDVVGMSLDITCYDVTKSCLLYTSRCV